MTGALEPIWEVFSSCTGRTVGYARACHHEPAIAAVLELAGIVDRDIDADLVPVAALETVPADLPAIKRTT
jgi:hypothetical protein